MVSTMRSSHLAVVSIYMNLFADCAVTALLMSSGERSQFLSGCQLLLAVGVRRLIQHTGSEHRAPVFFVSGAGRTVFDDCSRRWLVERENASTTDDAAQWEIAVADGCLDRTHETPTTRNTMSAWESLHCCRRRQTYYTLANQHSIIIVIVSK